MSITNIISSAGIRAIWNLDFTASRLCSACADMDLAEYGILASIYEREQGMSVRQLRGWMEDEGERFSRYHEERLLEKELIARMRDMADRRAIAYAVTSKGKKLVGQVDKAVTLALMGRFPNMGEADFGLFVDMMHALSAVRNQGMGSNLLFPSEAIRVFALSKSIFTREVSHASMSFSQLALLCILESEERNIEVCEIARRLAFESEIAEFLLDEMVERGIVDEGENVPGYSISQAGIERSRILRSRMGSSLASATANFEPDAKVAFDELKRYVVYRFA